MDINIHLVIGKLHSAVYLTSVHKSIRRNQWNYNFGVQN